MITDRIDEYLNEGKTVQSVQKKVDQLKKKLTGKPVKENFGEKEEDELNKFIGDIWSYGYSERLKIVRIAGDFFNWRTSYTGR